MGKVRQQNAHSEIRHRRPFFFGGRRVTSKELEDNGAPERGIKAYLKTGVPPTEGTGRHSTENAAKRARSSAERQ